MHFCKFSVLTAALLAPASLAASNVCSTGFYALLAPLAQDTAVRSFCYSRYRPGTSTVVSTTVTTPGLSTSTSTSTTVTVTTTTTTTTTTSTTTNTVVLQKRGPTSAQAPSAAVQRVAASPSAKASARSGRDAALASLSAVAANVVTTLCSCLYGGASTTTTVTTTTAPIPVTTTITTTTAISVSTSVVVTTTTTGVDPPYCYCGPGSGKYCRVTINGFDSVGACAQHVPATGANDPYYCYYQDDGCSGASRECRNDADCAPGGRSGANAGSIYCFKTNDGRNCNVCGSNKYGKATVDCPNPPSNAMRMLKRGAGFSRF